MHDDMHWLTVPQRVQYKFAMMVHHCLAPNSKISHRLLCVPVSEVPDRQRLPGIINCLFHVVVTAHLEAMLFLLPDQQSGSH